MPSIRECCLQRHHAYIQVDLPIPDLKRYAAGFDVLHASLFHLNQPHRLEQKTTFQPSDTFHLSKDCKALQL